MPEVKNSIFAMIGTRYVGHCDDCNRAVRSSRPKDGGRTCLIACPDCRVLTEGVRISAVPSGDDKCSTACRESYGLHCTCPCGGGMHGLYWGTGSKLQLITPPMLKAYRERHDAEAIARAVRLEKDMADRKEAFYKWAAEDGNKAVVARLLCAENPVDFVKDMRSKVMRFYPLTTATVTYLKGVFARMDDITRARRARFSLAKGGQQISGVIRRVRIYPNGMNGFRYQMYVYTPLGNLIRCELPCTIKSWSLAQDNFAGKKASPKMSAEEYWTEYLDGMPVVLHTILSPCSYDDTVALGTYPTQTSFPRNWKQERKLADAQSA